MIKRNWPCDPVCKLCDQEQETAIHLCLGCVYAREVWTLMEDWSGGLVRVPEQGLQIEGWWRNSLMHLPKKERRVAAALLMYTVWNIWKERNRRIFEGASLPATRVVALIKEEIGLRQSATGVPSVP